MVTFNFLVSALAALFPLVLGFVWYNPKVFGKAWMTGAGLTEDSAKGMNMPLVLGLAYVFSFFITLTLHFITIHQFGLQSLIQPEHGYAVAEGSDALAKQVMEAYSGSFRTFKHGALHGAISGIFFVLPIVGTGALFERRGWKYILINAGYWIVSMTVVGGIVCQYSK